MDSTNLKVFAEDKTKFDDNGRKSLKWVDIPFTKQALGFTCLQYKSFENTVGKETLLVTSNFPFSHSVFCPFKNLPCLSNLKLSSANSFSLEESKICCLGKGYTRRNIQIKQYCNEEPSFRVVQFESSYQGFPSTFC